MIETLNTAAAAFVAGAWPHFLQTALLAAILAILDLTLGRRLGVSWRCALWLIFFVKLVMPPQFSYPTGVAYWWAGAGAVVSAASPAPTAPPAAMPEMQKAADGWTDQPAPERPVASERRYVAPPKPTWKAGLMLAWFFGAALLGAVSLARHRRLVRQLGASEAASGRIQAASLRACSQVCLRRPLPVRLVELPVGPLVFGLWRPAIYLPRALVARLSADQLYSVIVHEACHVRRGDLWVAAAQSLFRVLFFHHPAVWWVNARVSRLREEATDRAVLADPEISARSYSLALVEAASLLMPDNPGSRFALGVIETKSQLNKRIKMNLHLPRPSRARLGYARIGSLLALAFVLIPMAPAQSRDEAPHAFKSVEPAPLLERIAQATTALMNAHNRRDYDGFVGAFTDDTLLLPDKAEFSTGKAAVGQMYLRAPKTLVYEPMVWSERNVYAVGRWLVETGTVDFRYKLSPEAPQMSEQRQALTIWQEDSDRSLKVKLLSWIRTGSSQPPAAVPERAFALKNAAGESSSKGDFAAVLEAEDKFHKLFEEQRPAEAAAYYAESGTLILQHQLVHGRSAIAQLIAAPQSTKLVRLERQTAHVEGNADLVLVVNLFRWTLAAADSQTQTSLVGKGVHVWQRGEDGAWRILFDLPNSSQPTG
ncbi:hypothetical protein DB347_03995 [Opitutaceae bacterium EW11]|nr:hypothetical protein DB347_03995 [Opitutaceae bacterium EW11]